MYYDLNIAWSPQSSAADIERTLRFSSSLGYDVVALNHTIGAPVPPQVTNPLPKYESSSPSTPVPTATTTPGPTPASSSTAPPTVGQSKLPIVLRRATLVLSEASQHHRLPQLASAYDMLAVRPQTEESFSAACLSLNDIALISLDLTGRQPFNFRPKPCMFAVNRGVRFEVCYSQALQGAAPAHVIAPKGGKDNSAGYSGHVGTGSVDARARASFIGNVSSLIRATRGRGILISSEARSALGLRAPADVVNLFHVWGLPADRAKEGLSVLPRGVVVNEGLKRSGFRGVIDIVRVADRREQREQPDIEMGEAGDEEVASGNGQGKQKNKNQGTNGPLEGKKRKNGDEASTAADPATGAEGGDQPMSKRQAKKLKAAQRKKEAAGEATPGS